MAQNIDQGINDFSHRIMKEMQLLLGERYPLYINCHEIENLSYLFENRCLSKFNLKKASMHSGCFAIVLP